MITGSVLKHGCSLGALNAHDECQRSSLRYKKKGLSVFYFAVRWIYRFTFTCFYTLSPPVPFFVPHFLYLECFFPFLS